MFNENGDDSLYWSTTNTDNESVLSYIPEDVWNESCVTCTSPGIWAGGGGVSIYSTAKPSWQSGVTGIPQDNARDLPDVALTAAGHDAYIVCLEGSCVPDSSGNFYIYLISGTSAATPSFAGIMAMVEQQTANTNPNPRQGQANYVLYRLAATENSTLSSCNASKTSALPASACIFNDVTVGNNSVPGEVNYGLGTAQYQAGVGYDMTTGLGSVNITNLINEWNSVTFNPTTTTLGLTPMTNIAHGSAVNVTIAVAPSSGTGTPAGDVSLLASDAGTSFTAQAAVDGFTLSSGTVAATTSQLPGGSYNVTANYAGDGTYAPSVSTPVAVTVTPEPSTTTLSVLTFNSQGNQLNFTGGPFGSFVYLRADVNGSSGYGTPTGVVTFTDTFGAIPGVTSLALNSGDTLNGGSSNTATPNGVVTFDTGTHTISAAYIGDASFNASTSAPPITFTITPGFFASVPSTSSLVSITAAGGSGTSSVTVSNSTSFSGTISLACSGLPSEATCTFSPASIKAAGTAANTTATITVTTTAATARNLKTSPYYLAQWLTGGFALAGVFFVSVPKGRRRALPLLLIVLAVIVMVPACGGGGGSSSSGGSGTQSTSNPGTPAGTYNITVTATSGTTSSTTGFTLNLQ